MSGGIPHLPPPSGLPNPLDSLRERRRHLREPEETEGLMFIENYLYRSDPFRSTTVNHPLPYPISIIYAGDTINAEASEHYEPIADILKDHRFRGRYDINVVEIARPEYPDGEPTTTLLIQYYDGAIFPHVPGRACDEIRDLLRRNLIDIHVEIVHLEHCFRPSLFAISPEHPTVPAYEQAKRDLIQILSKEFRDNWRSLCLFQVGSSKEKAVASIVILLDPRTSANFSNIGFCTLREVRRSLDPETPLQIEFLPGAVSPFPGDTGPPGSSPSQGSGGGAIPIPQLHLMDEVGRLQRGMSIGIKGAQGEGTMGGFVTFKRNNVTYQGILTSYHAVRPDNPAVTLADRKGISIDDSNRPKIEIVYPATKDARATKRQAQADYDKSKTDLRFLTERRDQNVAIGRGVTDRELKRIEDLEGQYQLDEQTLRSVKHLPSKIGDVIFASGIRIMGSKLLDWAFVEITEPNVKKFFRCDLMPRIPYVQRPAMDRGDVISFHHEGGMLNGIEAMKKGDYYVMVGRSSDIRVGRCNGTLISRHWRSGEVRYNENGDAVQASQVTEETVVIGEKVEHEVVQGPFCHPGDSGAFLINADGFVCGLLYGYLDAMVRRNEYTHAGLVICMSDVRSSAQALNHVEIDLPFP
ncbi:hypothetical protein PVAR5_3352 [Paecilomyces variotii No. 5]|uniref:Uncharacterized protein n=1 Tax=Byssochlamys spectabilis (strain No. 5 / NBRC 109023) TaxID=1356009 RepID=V5FRS1_BYSSN|nr:hypothetical protein PVAR5_3352 [Paecilomyces variotii No. 5]